MRVLLYEPGAGGHRLVILRYTIKILEQRGIGWVHEKRDLRGEPENLVLKAKATQCDVIYIMTLERLAFFAWQVSRLAKAEGVRLVGTYYLFNNLREGAKQWVWRALLLTGKFDSIFISDDALRDGRRAYPSQVRYLPDPWDPEEFVELSQNLARQRLGLPEHSVVFLLFGLINERKGADLLLKSISEMADRHQNDEVCFLLVGECAPSIRTLHSQLCPRLPLGIKCDLIDRHIAESEVSAYFYAADYVINAYPLDFKVSSGGITRALAAGRPSVVSDHGVNADLVKREDCGIVFESENADALAAALGVAIEKRLESAAPDWQRWCANAKAAGADRVLENYAKYLLHGLGWQESA